MRLDVLLTIGGGIANIVWLLVNLRIENKIGRKIDELKDWMGERYMSRDACEGCQKAAAVRFDDIERRLASLEGR